MAFQRIYWFRVKPALLLLVGIGAIVFSLRTPAPTSQDYTEIRGILVDFEVSRNSRALLSRSSSHITLVMRDGNRYSTSAITESEARSLFQKLPKRVAVYANYKNLESEADSAIRSIGLVIEGKDIVSLDRALEKERQLVRYLLPIFGIISVGVAIILYAHY